MLVFLCGGGGAAAASAAERVLLSSVDVPAALTLSTFMSSV